MRRSISFAVPSCAKESCFHKFCVHRVLVLLTVGPDFFATLIDQSTNNLLVFPPTSDNTAIKTRTKTRTQALASLTIGDLLHPSLIPIPSPLLPMRTTTPVNSLRLLEARTLSSTTIKQVTCTLRVWDSSWGRLFRFRTLQAKAMQQPQ